MKFFIFSLMGLVAFAASAADPRERIGHVLGQPVYRDQLAKADFENLAQIFGAPVWDAYKAKHEKELNVTDHEVKRYLDKQHTDLQQRAKELEAALVVPDISPRQTKLLNTELSGIRADLRNPAGESTKDFVKVHLGIWKQSRHFYLKYGGGRVTFARIGRYAADEATGAWWLDQQKKGNFAIEDPELNEVFWNEMRIGRRTAYKKEDLKEFLNPFWLDAAEAADDEEGGAGSKKQNADPGESGA